ncbi:MAG: ABC transporter ATP-binding protein [Lachnospiraceae bacterium]|nr:ABC transporter ATP-binding protein [Lachnospiraceae bacterium]
MLKYENVTISAGGERILSDINVSFQKGKLTSIIGPNGCGKTSLLSALNGSARVEKGNIYIDGENYLNFSPKKRGRTLSFLPQVRNTIPDISTALLVSHGRFPYLGFARSMTIEDKRAVEHAMDLADVKKYENMSVEVLSGGTRQRSFFALSLAQECEYMVADEPTTYLDIPGQRKMLNLYRKMRDEGKTVILVLHDIARALEISDEILVMDNRRIVFKGSSDEIIEKRIIEQVFGVGVKRFSDEDGTYYVI